MQQHKVLSTIEEIKIYSDPYRIQIMNMFNRQGRPSTVKEIADLMGEVPAKVHYHVKKLEKIGLLTMVSTREINGIIAKYYEPFSGEIHLRHKDEEDENSPLKQVFRSETLKLLNEMFEQSRQRFMNHAEHDRQEKRFISDMTLYATADEVEELYQNIVELCKPYLTKDEQKSDHQVFQLFTALSKEVQAAPQADTPKASKTSETSSTAKKSKPATKRKASEPKARRTDQM
ncbi:helix-turn-helix domain-containing protein [Paenibacillus sp. RRE4]|uniref:ArsR/SmtB family transcription factor n=1 Tax=Paenibacillus sp. RRE4 TaxID=2962587 RepID=UPI0028821BCD|nr:helix-turn-helix domain-containing protein [Paenibacillus sp. RRE4]MDT0122396.1 helix-turn-helix domain-containing protein [Paenibacillus sp. RRE4]